MYIYFTPPQSHRPIHTVPCRLPFTPAHSHRLIYTRPWGEPGLTLIPSMNRPNHTFAFTPPHSHSHSRSA